MSLRQALAAHQSGDLAEAEELYNDVLAAEPGEAAAHYNLGMIYGCRGDAARAVLAFTKAIEARPDFGEAWFLLCEFAGYAGQYETSCFAGKQAVRLMPDYARAWLHYGIAFSRLARDEEAIQAYRRALELDARLDKAWLNLSVAYMNEGCCRDAEAACRQALAIGGASVDESRREADENEYSLPYWHLALTELAQGKYREGFAHFRARYKGGTDWRRFNDPRPLWKGESLQGKTILVRVEQGHGDALMFCRYLPLLKKHGAAQVVFQVQPALMQLFENWAGADTLLSTAEKTISPTDFHTTIFDLPHRFGTAMETIPADVPYLPLIEPDANTKLETVGTSSTEQIPSPSRGGLGWGERSKNGSINSKDSSNGTPPHLAFPARGGELLKVAVVWNGNPLHGSDQNRSVPLEIFSEIFTEPDVEFYSFNRDMKPGDAELLSRFPVTDLAPRIGNFADAARFVRQCDLVITCDTAMAHLAGGFGLPVWTLLPFVPDWRWLIGRDDSPWYPTMRLFRQSRKGDWREVVARVKKSIMQNRLSLRR